MKLLAVKLRPAARVDVEEAASWYREQGGESLESRFVERFRAALDHIARHPLSGSVHYGDLTRLGGLRFWALRGFPYLVFYQDRGEWLDVWRVLHAERDIPAWLRDGT